MKKEKLFIFFKVVKQHAVAIAILLMLAVMFFMYFNKPKDVLGSNQIAVVQLDVDLKDKNQVTDISNKQFALYNNQTNSIGLGDVDVEFTASSSLEMLYRVENTTNNQCILNLKLDNSQIENLLIVYNINEESGILNNLNYTINSGEIIEVKVVVSIENRARSASFNGNLMLTLTNLGE